MKKVLLGLSAFLPVIASAQSLAGVTSLVNQIAGIVRLIGPIVFGIAIIYFFWGVTKFVLASDPKGVADGKHIMIWGVIGIAVMASIYGLVAWLQTTFGVSGVTTITVPVLP